MQYSVGFDLRFSRGVLHVAFTSVHFMYLCAQGSSWDFVAAQQHMIYSIISLKIQTLIRTQFLPSRSFQSDMQPVKCCASPQVEHQGRGCTYSSGERGFRWEVTCILEKTALRLKHCYFFPGDNDSACCLSSHSQKETWDDGVRVVDEASAPRPRKT